MRFVGATETLWDITLYKAFNNKIGFELKYLNYNDILPCEVSQARVLCGRLWDFCSFSNHLKLCCIIFLLRHEPHLVFNKQKKDPGRDPFLFHHDF